MPLGYCKATNKMMRKKPQADYRDSLGSYSLTCKRFRDPSALSSLHLKISIGVELCLVSRGSTSRKSNPSFEYPLIACSDRETRGPGL